MKSTIVVIIGSILFFALGFYVSTQWSSKNIDNTIKMPVNEDGFNVSFFKPIEYHVYIRNWAMQQYLKFSDSLFFNALSKDFYLDISIAMEGLNSLIKKEGSYYECVVFAKERSKYDFKNFYMITPDTIYRITLKPLKFEFDTIRPIRQENPR